MINTVFKELSIDRDKSKWEDFLFELTPIENHSGIYFKREDYFAPLGYGGINGSKLRQAIYLINKAINEGNIQRIISGASVKSPQLCFPGDEELLLSNGKRISFEDAYKSGGKIKVYTHLGDSVMAIEIDPPFITKEVDELVEIELDNGLIFKCTPEHLILTDSGYKKAIDLTDSDNLVYYGL